MSRPVRICLLAACALCLTCRLTAQPAGAKPIPTSNGEIWMVDESWFEKDTPLLEFYKFGEEDGLKIKQSAILLLQDSRGDIWLRDDDQDNIIRFDGHEFRYYAQNPDNSAQLLNSNFDAGTGMVEAPDGRLWAKHDKGFSCYDPPTDRFLNFPVKLDSIQELPTAFFQGREQPPGFFDLATNRFIRAFHSKIVDGTNPSRRVEARLNWLLYLGWTDSEGNIWTWQHTPIGRGLVCVNPSQGTTTLYPMLGMAARDKASSPDYDPWITAFCPDAAGENLWVAGWRGGLRRFNLQSKRWTQFAQNYKKDENGVSVDLETTLFITPASDGRLWLGTNHGLSLFDPESFQFRAWWHTKAPGSYSPGNHNLSTAFTDKAGRFWVSAGSLSVHDTLRHFIQKTGIQLPQGRIRGIFYDSLENKTWMLKEDNYHEGSGGVFSLDEGTGQVRAYTSPGFYNEKAYDKIQLYNLSKRGSDVFFVSEYAIYRLQTASGKMMEIKIPAPPELASKYASLTSLRDIALAPDGNFWISIYNTESNIPLVHYFPDDDCFEYVRALPGGLTIAAGGWLFVDHSGKVWLMSSDTERSGINCYDPKTNQVRVFRHEPDNPFSLSNNYVKRMAEDRRGRIWMATLSGVCWYDPLDGKIRQVPGYVADSWSLAIDHRQNVWISGDAPACYYPESGKLQILSEKNGLYWKGEALYTRKDGAVCWGPYYRIFPDKIPVLTEGPVCRLTAFKVFDRDLPTPKAIDFLEKIELQHFDNTFSIAWSARNFTNPEQDSFFYQLEGMDEDWVAVGADHLSSTYLKVPPGNYVFRLKCKNRDGVFGSEKQLTVRIIPAFYQTIWFKLLIISALVAIVAVIASLRQRQKRLLAELKQKEAEFRQKEAEFNQRISEYQMAALRAQMNPHFIFNSLNSINRFVQMSGPDAASNYLTKFARLIRLVLDNSRSDVITLDSELEAVKLYLELESLRFAGQFEYHLDLDEDLDSEAVHVPPLFIQPYLENAIWHGLMQKEGADKKLKISLRLENPGLLSIHIRDNGIGRQQAMALRSKSAARQKSYGMDITAERLRMFTERTGKKIGIEIIDLTDGQGQPTGTSVKILLET